MNNSNNLAPTNITPNKLLYLPKSTPMVRSTPFSDENTCPTFKNYLNSPSPYKSNSSDSNRIEKSTLLDGKILNYI